MQNIQQVLADIIGKQVVTNPSNYCREDPGQVLHKAAHRTAKFHMVLSWNLAENHCVMAVTAFLVDYEQMFLKLLRYNHFVKICTKS